LADFSAGDLHWSDDTLWAQFERLAQADASAVALIDCDDRHWSRAELQERAHAVAADFRAAGVEAGSRVLVAGHKRAGTLVIALAVSSLGATFCPYSPKLTSADRAVLEARLGHVAHAQASDEDAVTIDPATRPAAGGSARTDVALIGFTSGSTGVPKGVMHGHIALNYATRACAAIAGLQPGDSILGIVPLDSAPGYTFTAHFALSLGHPLVMIDPWEPSAAMDRAVRYNGGWAIMVPTHLFTMVEAARTGAWVGRLPLRACAVGGSAMTPELIADADRLLGLKALRMFGMSECMGHSSARPGDPLDRRQNFDGIPFPGTQEEAFDANEQPLPRGVRGQAGVRGPSLFLGYADGLGAGQERLTADGFYLTGDEITRDDDGFVKVVGRIKDQIIRGGFNIDPAEIEAALLRHPAIAEVAVVGVPERKLGEQACAVCRIRDGAEPVTFDQVIAHLQAEGLSRKKWPEHLLLVDRMVVGATGKLDKKAMAAHAISTLVPA
jgi:acyl-CoA synthetase